MIESLKGTVAKLQEDLTQQKTVTDAVTEKNIKVSKDIEKLGKQLQDTQLVLSLIKQVLPPEVLTKLQHDWLHKEYEKQRDSKQT